MATPRLNDDARKESVTRSGLGELESKARATLQWQRQAATGSDFKLGLTMMVRPVTAALHQGRISSRRGPDSEALAAPSPLCVGNLKLA